MRIVVVGAGIVGLATARQLAIERPDAQITVLDKEPRVAAHQTGHNSGVIHAGIYYPPGSLKAQLCRQGSVMLKTFCREQGIPYQDVGKLVVALDAVEAGRLDELHQRALANGVSDARLVDRSQLLDIEPHVAGVRALYSPSTAIVDFIAVTAAIAVDLTARGGEVRTATPVIGFRQEAGSVVVLTEDGGITADEVVICAGLQAARMGTLAGDDPEPGIVPFRGEYYRIVPERADLVNGLVYPVPDPRYPFLGIHLTRRIDGTVDIGPNAVLAFALEGYRRTDFSARDLGAVLRTPAFRKLARTHWRTGAREMFGSVSKRHFLGEAQKYLPALQLADLRPAPAGVRAQAIKNNGDLVDDFWITRRPRLTLVRNAPSPAATSSLAIAKHITKQILDTAAV